MAIFLEGFDGHCLRAYNYWKDKMPDIDPTDVDSVNSIKDKYDDLRSKSKAPSFALQYLGTAYTLQKNCGFSPEESESIYNSYVQMYKTSFDWVDNEIKIASKRGYAVGAFGLRIRTPVLARTVLDSSYTPKFALGEKRSVANAISGQSYGLLNNRAFNEFMQRVWDSPYKYDVMPVALIHDAIYLMFKQDLAVVEWVNKNLVECMNWQELPELQHPEIGLPANLDIYYPSWANKTELPNNATQEQIYELMQPAS